MFWLSSCCIFALPLAYDQVLAADGRRAPPRASPPTPPTSAGDGSGAATAAASASPAGDPAGAAKSAKEAGSTDFVAGRYDSAQAEYTSGLQLLRADAPITDFGLGDVPIAAEVAIGLAAMGPEAAPLAVVLLQNRAAAALKLGRTFRALADASAAAALDSAGAKAAYRLAQVGGCGKLPWPYAPYIAVAVML